MLVLGAGWTGDFLLPLLRDDPSRLEFAATTRDGRTVAGVKTIKWAFEPSGSGGGVTEGLPKAHTVVITFPLRGAEQCHALCAAYESHVRHAVRFVLLGSTGAFVQDGTATTTGSCYIDRHAAVKRQEPRVEAEECLLRESDQSVVLNLAGLYGGARDPRTWLARVARDKAALHAKGSLHLVHGADVARAILAVVRSKRTGRYLVTDLHTHDWWHIALRHGARQGETPHATWASELVVESTVVRALPRSHEQLARVLDSREFWQDFGLAPSRFFS